MLHLKKHKLIKFVVFLAPIYCIKWFLSFNRTKCLMQEKYFTVANMNA